MTISLMRKRKWRKWRSIMANNKEIDQQLLKKMFNVIRNTEINNIKTQKRDDKGMVNAIEKYISDMVQREANGNED